MLRDKYLHPALLFNAVVLAGISTVLALALYTIPQQVLRQGANDPQIQLAGDLAARLEQGVAAAEVVPAGAVDIARSLSPFVIAYDDQGRPLASQAQLDGKTPVPPSGVFNYAACTAMSASVGSLAMASASPPLFSASTGHNPDSSLPAAICARWKPVSSKSNIWPASPGLQCSA